MGEDLWHGAGVSAVLLSRYAKHAAGAQGVFQHVTIPLLKDAEGKHGARQMVAVREHNDRQLCWQRWAVGKDGGDVLHKVGGCIG